MKTQNKTPKKRKHTWDISKNAVAIPYKQVPLARMTRRTTWQNGIYDKPAKESPYWCPICNDSLSFERFWSRRPQKLEILIPFCRNNCNLETKWISIAHQLRSKKPKRIKNKKRALKIPNVEIAF